MERGIKIRISGIIPLSEEGEKIVFDHARGNGELLGLLSTYGPTSEKALRLFHTLNAHERYLFLGIGTGDREKKIPGTHEICRATKLIDSMRGSQKAHIKIANIRDELSAKGLSWDWEPAVVIYASDHPGYPRYIPGRTLKALFNWADGNLHMKGWRETKFDDLQLEDPFHFDYRQRVKFLHHMYYEVWADETGRPRRF